MIGQTLCYGLFAAKYNQSKITDYNNPLRTLEFNRINAKEFLPKTNEVLNNLFNTVFSYDVITGISYIIDDVVEILKNTDMGAVLVNFGVGEDKDPIIHFYETFLNKYDPEYKKKLGVFYTPRPVVDYIVRSIDYVLREDFEEPLGLASDTKEGDGEFKVQILDPATGTGAFLTDIINNIHKTVTENITDDWNSYVNDILLKRLNAFEIMMAPYTIAHINVSQLLTEQGWDKTGALSIVLADTLQEPKTEGEINSLRIPGLPKLKDEIKKANKIKKNNHIMVILGNPPYAGNSANSNNRYIMDMVDKAYYPRDDEFKEKNFKYINDDYVKFIRFAQDKIDKTKCGVLGFITNNGYITNPTFRKMRTSLMKTFNKIYILNLHGSLIKHETCPDGSKDENVFDIRVGVSVIIAVKDKSNKSFVKYKDIYGLRNVKFEYLRNNSVETTDFKIVEPQEPFYIFAPRNNDLESEYNKYDSVRDILTNNSLGIATGRDILFIDFKKDKLWERITDLKDLPCETVREKYNIGDNTRDFNLEKIKNRIENNYNFDNIENIYYRPFDNRYIYYSKVCRTILEYPRYDIMQHLFKNNLALSISRRGVSNKSLRHIVLISNKILSMDIFSPLTNVFPFYLYQESEGGLDLAFEEKTPNLSKEFIEKVASATSMEYVPLCDEIKLDTLSENQFAPRHIFNYIYGLLSGKAYREKYMEFIDTDFPRVPVPKNKELFLKIGEFGDKLINLHLMKNVPLEAHKFVKGDNSVVGKITYNTDKIYINDSSYFENVSPEVWEFNMGGYQVLAKYLKDRKGRDFDFSEQSHYQKIISVLNNTLKLTDNYDEYIKEEI